MTRRTPSDSEALRAGLRQRLPAALARVGQTLPEAASARLVDYLVELHRWNRAYNLTAVTDPDGMIERHVLDSLAVRPWLAGARVLDAGTGAGLPGVVLAIAEPQRHFVLVDSAGKKIRFLRNVVRRLDLANVEPVQSRLESLSLDPPPDDIVARALAPLPRLIDWLAPWLDRGARLLAMKGPRAVAEAADVPEEYRVEIHPLNWPGADTERRLVIVRRRTG